MNIELEIQKYANKEKAKVLQRFFKTGPGQYGEGDIFLGLVVGDQRKIAKQFKDLSMRKIENLLNSKIHEKRLIGLLVLIEKYKVGDEKIKQEIFNFYLKNTRQINNWDLVDLSAPNIVGNFLLDKDRKVLYGLVKSENLWEKRIAIVSTFTFIRNGKFEDTLAIAKILLDDKHDLIHKAVGWMLREVGKGDKEVLEEFLRKHYKEMPRTMLRYSIEKFEESKRLRYLKGEV